jgi:hypothetical protein
LYFLKNPGALTLGINPNGPMTKGLITYFARTYLRIVAEHHYDIKEAII